jgi:hypothetical protein
VKASAAATKAACCGVHQGQCDATAASVVAYGSVLQHTALVVAVACCGVPGSIMLQLAVAAAAASAVVVVVVWGCGWERDEMCPEDLRMCSKMTIWKFKTCFSAITNL